MRTLTEKYNGVLKGLFSKDQFLRDARMEQSQLVTQYNSYNDAVNILLNKGLISEIALEEINNQNEIEEGYKVSKDSIEVRQLKKGDVLHGTGVEILNISAGVSTPQGKMDVTVRYPNGKVQTNQWWKTTKVVLKRAPQTPEQELETLKRIWSRTPQEKWSDALKSKIADLESKVSNMQEGFEEVNGAYSDILKLYNDHYRQLSQVSREDAYALHELLKSYFNRLFEGTIEEAPTTVERNDELEHINPTGPSFKVSTFGKTRVSGPVTKAGTYKGKDYRVHDLIQIKPIEVGAVFKKLPAAKPEVKYANLAEAKEEGYQAPKAELPLDVLHHGIRFELDKKQIGNTPTGEEYMKAYKAAAKNLEKDLLHYKKEEGATEAPSSKSDEMVKVKLKEGFKKIIRNILSENSSNKKAFNLNGKPL